MTQHDPTDTPPRARRRSVAIATLTLGALATGGVVAALATSADASGPSGSGSSGLPASSSAASSAASPRCTTNAHRPVAIDGSVTSLGPGTITVTDRDGFRRSIVTEGSTTYSSGGKSVARSTLTSGVAIHAEGSVDADKTSLDADSVTRLVAGAGPAGRPGRGAMPAPPAKGTAPKAGAPRAGAPKAGPPPCGPAGGPQGGPGAPGHGGGPAAGRPSGVPSAPAAPTGSAAPSGSAS